MSDLTRYRVKRVVECESYPNGNMIQVPIYVEDSTLQDLANAWNEITETEKSYLRYDWKQLAKVVRLLDGLVDNE